MSDRKMIAITDFLTPQEIRRAMRLYREATAGTFAQRCADEIITPVMGRINRALGQENDAKFLAYAVEHMLRQSAG